MIAYEDQTYFWQGRHPECMWSFWQMQQCLNDTHRVPTGPGDQAKPRGCIAQPAALVLESIGISSYEGEDVDLYGRSLGCR